MKILKISLLRLMALFLACFTTTMRPGMVLDESFGVGGMVTMVTRLNEDVDKVFIKPDGKIVTVSNTPEHSTLIQYNQNGSLDRDFGFRGISRLPGGNIASLITQHNGKVIVAGQKKMHDAMPLDDMVEEQVKPLLSRYSSNTNILDRSFNPQLDFLGTLMSVAIQPDDKIITAGFELLLMIGTHTLINRYNIDGTLDNTFDTERLEIGFEGIFRSIALQSNGKIVAFGKTIEDRSFLVCYNSNGTIDRTFGVDGLCTIRVVGNALSIALQPDNKIIVLGVNGAHPNPFNNHIFLARYNSNGTLDQTFGPDGTGILLGAHNNGYPALALQEDGKIILLTSLPGARLRSVLTCYNANGLANTEFGPDGTNVLQLPQNIHGVIVLTHPETQTLFVIGTNNVRQPILLRYRKLNAAEIEQKRLTNLAIQEAAYIAAEINALLNIETLEQCGICLEEANMHYLQETPCHHFFHPTCMTTWKNTGAHSCPLCRTGLPNLP